MSYSVGHVRNRLTVTHTALRKSTRLLMGDKRNRRQGVVARLAGYRLVHDLTFDALAAEMAEVGYPLTARLLHNALTGRTQPNDRALYKIQQFLALRAAQRKHSAA